MSNEPTTTVVVPAVTVSNDFLSTIATALDALRAVDIDGQLRRVFEVVRPEYQRVTADMPDGVYEVFTRATRYEELHTELAQLARAALAALALGEGDMTWPAWVPDEVIAADDAEVLTRARGTVAMYDELARIMGASEA